MNTIIPNTFEEQSERKFQTSLQKGEDSNYSEIERLIKKENKTILEKMTVAIHQSNEKRKREEEYKRQQLEYGIITPFSNTEKESKKIAKSQEDVEEKIDRSLTVQESIVQKLDFFNKDKNPFSINKDKENGGVSPFVTNFIRNNSYQSKLEERQIRSKKSKESFDKMNEKGGLIGGVLGFATTFMTMWLKAKFARMIFGFLKKKLAKRITSLYAKTLGKIPFVDKLVKSAQRADTIMGKIWGGVKWMTDFMFSGLWGRVKKLYGLLKPIKSGINSVKKNFTKSFLWISNTLSPIRNIVTNISGRVTAGFDWVASKVGGIFGFMKSIPEKLYGILKGIPGFGLIEGSAKKILGIGQKTAQSGAGKAVTGGAQTAAGKVSNWAGNLWKNMKGGISKMNILPTIEKNLPPGKMMKMLKKIPMLDTIITGALIGWDFRNIDKNEKLSPRDKMRMKIQSVSKNVFGMIGGLLGGAAGSGLLSIPLSMGGAYLGDMFGNWMGKKYGDTLADFYIKNYIPEDEQAKYARKSTDMSTEELTNQTGGFKQGMLSGKPLAAKTRGSSQGGTGTTVVTNNNYTTPPPQQTNDDIDFPKDSYDQQVKTEEQFAYGL